MDNEPKAISPQIEYLAALMDDRFEMFGFRFGLNMIIDLIPGIGDIVTTIVALYIFVLAFKYKTSAFVHLRMVLNIAVYFIIIGRCGNRVAGIGS